MPINRQDAQPLSAQIAADLRRRITEEQYPVGEKLPSLRTLASEYGVAELTVHAAVKELQHEGVLASTSGRGTFVVALPATARDGSPDVAAVLEAMQSQLDEFRSRLEAVERAQVTDRP